MTRQNSDKISIAVINSNIVDIKEDLRDIKNKLEADYVTRQEFDPVKKIVYGLVSVILLAVVGALVTLVINK